MNTISLKAQNIHQHTLINNLFIDHFMPRANGDFVKVYLYLLRLVCSGQGDINTKEIAKQLRLIESDVIRALRYWEDEQVLEVAFDDDEVISVGFLSLEKAPIKKTELKVSKEVSPKAQEKKEENHQGRIYTRPQYSMEEILKLKEDEELSQLIYITERYIGKPLTQTDINALIGFHDWLGLPIDVVEFLVEHCTSANHRHMNYMEKIAIDWSENKIKDVASAKAYTEAFNKNYGTILRALGLQTAPTKGQIKYMDRWLNDYNFALEVIELACDKTIATIGKPQLAYVDTILTRWHNKGAKSLEAIEEMDKTFKRTSSKTETPTPAKSKNRFHNHEQRDYDYDALEAKMQELIDKESKETEA